MTPDFKTFLAIIIGTVALMGAGCVAIIKCAGPVYQHNQKAEKMDIDQRGVDRLTGAVGVQK